jgi:hypothetical protein
MDLIASWVLFPLLLGLVFLGCGLLAERLSGRELPGPLLVPLGFAVVIAAGELTTSSDATAELTTPLVAGLAVAGFGLAWPLRRLRRVSWPLAAAAAGVFAVFAAPVVLSGQATFTGYIKLDDTATWFALTDRIMQHGHSLAGLPPSSYEATVQINLDAGYPVGAFVPLGVGHELTGIDLAWIFQPFLAVLAVMLALVLWVLAGEMTRARAARALTAFAAAQPALLYAYAMWGGIKELEAAVLVALAATLGALTLTEPRWRAQIPLALTAAALLATLGPGGAVWLVGLLVPAIVIAVRSGAAAAAGRSLLAAGGVALLVAIPVLLAGFSPTQEGLTSERELGNLVAPLSALQLGGIWPAGDFRVDPVDQGLVNLVIALVAGMAVAGLLIAAGRGQRGVTIYGVGGLLALIAITFVGSPWIDAKAMATASPLVILLAAGAIAWPIEFGGRRGPAVAAVLGVLVVGGIVWSNALAYRDVNLAPRPQLAELEHIGSRIAGQGPTLMTEYQPYGVRHFLRDADPEGASELRRRLVLTVEGKELPKGAATDTDQLQLGGLMIYRTLVLRRSPAQSRPPLPYRLIDDGDFYEVWQRPEGTEGTVIRHLGLGDVVQPSAVPACKRVLALAQSAPAGSRLAAAAQPEVVALPLSATSYPAPWAQDDPSYPVPSGAGTLSAAFEVPRRGAYAIWLGGSVRPDVTTTVDGVEIGAVRNQLNNAGEYVLLGRTRLSPGRHRVEITFGGTDLHPGSGGQAAPIGPLVLAPSDASQARVSYFDPSDARRLCGRPWDWIELIAL